jgi:hypothetical protein
LILILIILFMVIGEPHSFITACLMAFPIGF